MAKMNPLEEFDWDVFEDAASSQSEEESNEETTDDAERMVVSGIVISINEREIVVNIGYSNDGIIPASEFRYNPDLKVGDTVDVYCVYRIKERSSWPVDSVTQESKSYKSVGKG